MSTLEIPNSEKPSLREQLKSYISNHKLPLIFVLLIFFSLVIYFKRSGSSHLLLSGLLYAAMVTVLLAPSKNRIFELFHLASALLLPVFVFYEFEILSGNYRTIIKPYTTYSFLLLYLILFLAMCLLTFRIGALVFAAFGNIFSLANYFVIQFRGTPIALSDLHALKTAATVADNYTYTIPGAYLCLTLATLILALLFLRANPVGRLSKKIKARIYDKIHIRSFFYSLSLRIAAFAAGVFLLITLFFRLPTDGYYAYLPDVNYAPMGWLYTSCMQLRESILESPDGYSKTEVRALLDQSEEPEILNDTVPDKLIIVMNESFSDLSVLGDFNTNQDYMPFLHSLEKNTEKGYLSVPTLGGGTCNTEWEVLSGNNKILTKNGFSPYSSFYSPDSHAYNTASLASDASAEGYYPIAMHPQLAENWNRSVVYPQMGFRSFLSYFDYGDSPLLRGFVSDRGNYRKIIQYDQNTPEDRLFIFNVTIQNHGGYDDKEPDYDISVKNTDIDDPQTNHYLSLIYESDQAFKELIEYYEASEEPVMIVMFGDHQPNLPEDFYKNIYGCIPDENEVNELRYITPYVIWSNYPRNTGNVPFMSTNYFGAYIKQAAGWELSPYDQFLLQFMKKFPAIGHYGVFDSSYDYTSYPELSEEQNTILDELRFVQYYHMTDTPE